MVKINSRVPQQRGRDRRRVKPPIAILLIEDSGTDAMVLQRDVALGLPDKMVQVDVVGTLAEGLEYVDSGYAAVVCDLNLPDSAGAATAARVATDFVGVPVVAISSSAEYGPDCISGGADEFVCKADSDPSAIGRAITFAIRRAERDQQDRYLSQHDLLTGLLRRASFQPHAERLISGARKFNCGIGFLIGDIDNFKQVNDEFGHSAGDEVLIQFSQLLRNATRAHDLVCRWGGDEFVVLALIPSDADWSQIVDRIKSECRLNHDGYAVSMSFGQAFRDRPNKFDFLNMFDEADNSMFAAKGQPKGVSQAR